MIMNDCVNGIFLLASPRGRAEKGRNLHGVVSFVVNPWEILKGKRTSYLCENCGKALCVVPCFKIYHAQTDYKLHAKKFRQGVLEVEGAK